MLSALALMTSRAVDWRRGLCWLVRLVIAVTVFISAFRIDWACRDVIAVTESIAAIARLMNC
jgi:hypothetical protein